MLEGCAGVGAGRRLLQEHREGVWALAPGSGAAMSFSRRGT